MIPQFLLDVQETDSEMQMRINEIGLSLTEIEQILECTAKEQAAHDRRQSSGIPMTCSTDGMKLVPNKISGARKVSEAFRKTTRHS